jgi:FlaA1/EpsC-like NDP-sugar epimerase
MDQEVDLLSKPHRYKALDRLVDMPRWAKQTLLITFDLCAIPLAIWLAVVLRWGGFTFNFSQTELLAAVVTVAASAFIFIRTGLYRAMVRYMGQQTIMTVVRDVSYSAIVLALVLFLLNSTVPRSTPFIYWALALSFIGGSRLLVRTSYQNLRRWTGKKVAIYGAGASGRQLLHSLFQSGEFAPMVFLDDNRGLQGTVINGIPVFDPRRLPDLINDIGITHVLLAMPNVTRSRKRKVIDQLALQPVNVKTIPSFSALVSGLAQVGDVIDVDVEDLLGREIVPPQPHLLRQCITDKVVLVTGAGGSIGSELCRQILACNPTRIVLVDLCEYNLYSISRELEERAAQQHQTAAITPLLLNVQNEQHMRNALAHYQVATVYHAAAYKHVPIVENNITAGVENNVFGTLALSRAAAAANVETFVLISTDKAVRPTNIMGATKRVAELIVQAFADKYKQTKFCVVRFGNVLGSSGSVVPLFREQISKGGPVTVTHLEVQRYFMTIPEAAQLVLQASSMSEEGDVFVLDMGEPVHIVDLARRMIKLLGHVEKTEEAPDGDIEIQLIGLRPGEKLVEELLLSENVVGTGHPKILSAREEWLPEEKLMESLTVLKSACDTANYDQLQSLLVDIVKGFKGMPTTSDAAWSKRAVEHSADNNVYALFSKEKTNAGD